MSGSLVSKNQLSFHAVLRATPEALAPPTPKSFTSGNTSPSLDTEWGGVGLSGPRRQVNDARPSFPLGGSGNQLATMLAAYQADLDATVQNARQEARTEVVRLQAENSALKANVARLERQVGGLNTLVWQKA